MDIKVRNRKNEIFVVINAGGKTIKKSKEIIYRKFKIVITCGQRRSSNWGRGRWGFRGAGGARHIQISCVVYY